jgi:CelD/BcsL family acetyltransferase involved in cellulose biosynthesis
VAQGREVGAWRHCSSLDEIGEAWDDLLARSSADPLFNSREWLTAWWSRYAPVIGGELDVRALGGDGGLAALALMHRRRVRHRLGLSGTRLELLGTARGVAGVGFSERTDFILEAGAEPELVERLAADLAADDSWSDLVVSYAPEGGVTHQVMAAVAGRYGADLRVVDGMEAWELPLDGDFEAFLAGLGSGTRARLMNGRKRLEQAGALRERVLEPGELEQGWDIFGQLHLERWDRPFSAHWRQFYGAIARAQAKRGMPVISLLELDGRPLSLMVNFRAGAREYSIAAVFRPVDIKRVSPGWVHFGMVIERACADGVKVFDFLGGEGKNEQYKAAFGGASSQLVCLHLVRPLALKWSYRALDLARQARDRLKGRAG